MNQSKKITEGALMLAIFIVILATTFFIPVISVLFLPIPFVIYTRKHGLKPGFLMLAVALIVSTLLMTVFSIPLVVMMGLAGIMIGYGMYKEVTAYDTLARGIFGFIIGILFTLGFTQVFLDVNLINQFEVVVEDSVEMSTSFMEQFGLEGQTEEMAELVEAQIEMLTGLLPTFLVAAAAILAFVAQWVSYKIINRMDKVSLRFPPFRELRFPTSIIWIYIVALMVFLFSQDPESTLYIGAQNLFFIVGMLLALQGLSFVFYYAHAKKMSKAIPVLIVVLTLVFPQFLLYFIEILGIIDIVFPLRNRIEKKK